MTEIRDFRDMVNEEISFKDARAKAIKLNDYMFYKLLIKDGDFESSSNLDNGVKVSLKGSVVEVQVTETYNMKFKKVSPSKLDELFTSFNVKVDRFFTFYADKSLEGKMRTEKFTFGLSNAEFSEVKLNGSSFKLDKKTKESLTRNIRNVKLKESEKVSLLNILEKNNKVLDREAVQKLPEVQKMIEKSEDVLAKEEQAELKKKNKIEFEAQALEAKIARKQKVKGTQVAAHDDETYIVFSKDIVNIKDARMLARSYDCETWAIDRGYREAQDRNERIIKQMAEFGNGTFYYVTHPGGNRSEMEIKF